MNDDELEQLMRTGLHRKANEVADHGRYAELARQGAHHRRHTRVGLVAAVAAAVLVGGVALADLRGDEPQATQSAGPTPSGETSQTGGGSTPTVPADWRVESYGGVQLYVPPEWGWGGVPIDDPR